MSADADPRDPRFFSTSSLPTSPTAPAPRSEGRDPDGGPVGGRSGDVHPGGPGDATRRGSLDAPHDEARAAAGRDPRLEPLARPPGDPLPAARPVGAAPDSEAIRRVPVDDEDRLAFRVGVNLLVLLALAGLAWWGARALGWLGG